MCLLKTKIPKELKTPVSEETLSMLLMECHASGHQMLFCNTPVLLVTCGMSCHAIAHQVIYNKFYGFEIFFLPSCIFYLTLFPASFYHGILGPVVQPQNQQSFMLWFKTQSRPKCLFESHQSTDLKYRRCFYI